MQIILNYELYILQLQYALLQICNYNMQLQYACNYKNLMLYFLNLQIC